MDKAYKVMGSRREGGSHSFFAVWERKPAVLEHVLGNFTGQIVLQ